MEIIHDAPEATSYVPVSEHQSQTPASFYSGPPVLYYQCSSAHLVILDSELKLSPALSKLSDNQVIGAEAATNGDSGNHQDEEVVISSVEIWVTSEKFILYRQAASTGLSVPYPSISLHAVQRLQLPSSTNEVQGLFMQISVGDGFDDHNPDDTISLTLVPSTPCSIAEPTSTSTVGSSSQSTGESAVQSLFAAVSACANLHPDPASPSSSADLDVDQTSALDYETLSTTGAAGGLPPSMPGSGGWITADNIDEFYDEEGNWRAGGLGPGAGLVRPREYDTNEDADEVVAAGNGHDAEDSTEETKWRRTD